MKTAFLFPGQGAQYPGMGKDLYDAYPAAKGIFDQANDIVGYDLRSICFDGPEETLNSTVMSQPAIFVVSTALLEVFRSETSITPDLTAGLSLGEYTALYAAGRISFKDGLKLVQKRGQAMQKAADASDGSMVSLLGLDEKKVTDLCNEAAENELLVPANFNCPGQIVVSGSSSACQRCVELADKYGAMKAVQLKVAGAFHTSMMKPAADELDQALRTTSISEKTDIDTIANIDAHLYDSSDDIRHGLIHQLISPILWQKCMETLLETGFDQFYEIGPGRVLTGLMKRINRKIKVKTINDSKSFGALQA